MGILSPFTYKEIKAQRCPFCKLQGHCLSKQLILPHQIICAPLSSATKQLRYLKAAASAMPMCIPFYLEGYGNKLTQEKLERKDYENKKKTLIFGREPFILI